jgi:hypothetical protein
MIKYNNQITEHTFYHIDLGDDHMLLGMPFLAATNPNIDWTNRTFEGKVIAATKDAHKWSLHDRSKPIFIYPEEHPDSHHYRPHFPAYMHFKPDNYAFINKPQEPIHICQTTKSTTLAAEAVDKTKCTWQEQVPLEYHCFGKVFSKEESQRLPGSRLWDYAIDLIAKAPLMLDCKTYPLAPGQQELLDKFLKEHLAKGYICISKSPYASPFFFVKKKDSKQRPVQDYRKLNQLTM